MPGFPVHHQLLELALTHAHWWCHWWCHPTKSINSLALSFLWRNVCLVLYYHLFKHFMYIISVFATPRRRQMAPHSSTLAWKIPWMEEPGRLQSMGCEESDMTEWLHFHFSPSCIGEGNGNPLQCSYLENPRDRGAWWAAIYGVAQSRTWLKRLSSSSSSSRIINFLSEFLLIMPTET